MGVTEAIGRAGTFAADEAAAIWARSAATQAARDAEVLPLAGWATEALETAAGRWHEIEPPGGSGLLMEVGYETIEGFGKHFPTYVRTSAPVRDHYVALRALRDLVRSADAPTIDTLDAALTLGRTTAPAAHESLRAFVRAVDNPFATKAGVRRLLPYDTYTTIASASANEPALRASLAALSGDEVTRGVALLRRFGPAAWDDASSPLRSAADRSFREFANGQDSYAMGLVNEHGQAVKWIGGGPPILR